MLDSKDHYVPVEPSQKERHMPTKPFLLVHFLLSFFGTASLLGLHLGIEMRCLAQQSRGAESYIQLAKEVLANEQKTGKATQGLG